MASKSKRRRKVLGASCILAALIIAGSSFAWFTSKDEVTNRLTASSDYGVTIAEDFQPPENWVPGQKIEKNVGIVNTGNIDAFVRARLEGELRLTAEKRDIASWKEATTGGSSTPAGMYVSANKVLGTDSALDASSDITPLTKTTDKKLIDLGLTYSCTGSGTNSPTYYVKELNKTYRDSNPEVNGSGTANETFTEVESIQAGGTLAYFDGTGTFTYTPQKAIDIVNSNNDHVVLQKGYTYTVSVGTSQTIDVVKGTDNDSAKTGTITYSNMQGFVDALGQYIDCTSFKPTNSGLYIFRRNAQRTGTGNSQTDDFEFTGYYYVADATPTAGGGKYFALQYENDGTQRSSYVLEDDTYMYDYDYTTSSGVFTPTKTVSGTTKAVTLFTAEQQLLKTTDNDQKLHWVYTDKSGSDEAYLTATYEGGSGTADDLKIKVQLANTSKTAATAATDAEQWTAIGTDYAAGSGGSGATKGEWSFYYNNDLEEGATTSRLVDALTLDQNTTNDAYLAFDFDLNVYSESVQVTIDDEGKESITSAQANFDDPNGYVAIASTNGVAKGGTGAEIEYLTWSNT